MDNIDFIQTLQHLSCCAFMKDKAGHYLFMNDVARETFSIDNHSILGQSDEQLFANSHTDYPSDQDNKALQGEGVTKVQMKRLKDGSVKHFQSIRTPIFSKSGDIVGLIGLDVDISETIKKCQNLQELALHDAVTGLYNRRFLDAQLSAEIALHEKKQQPLSLIMLDIDNFKAINDDYGHEVGDHALVLVSTLIKQSLRHEDICCRFGGDEFSILLPLTPQWRAFLLAERIRKRVALHQFTAKNGVHFTVTISLGVGSLAPGMQADALKRSADQALLMAKKMHKNNCLVNCNQKDKITCCYQERALSMSTSSN